MIAAHPNRHAMTNNDLIAFIDDWHLADLADSKNEALWWINDGGKTVNSHSAEVRHRKTSSLKLFRLHSFVAHAAGQVLRQLADLPQRFVLRRANHRREQSVLNRNGNAKI